MFQNLLVTLLIMQLILPLPYVFAETIRTPGETTNEEYSYYAAVQEFRQKANTLISLVDERMASFVDLVRKFDNREYREEDVTTAYQAVDPLLKSIVDKIDFKTKERKEIIRKLLGTYVIRDIITAIRLGVISASYVRASQDPRKPLIDYARKKEELVKELGTPNTRVSLAKAMDAGYKAAMEEPSMGVNLKQLFARANKLIQIPRAGVEKAPAYVSAITGFRDCVSKVLPQTTYSIISEIQGICFANNPNLQTSSQQDLSHQNLTDTMIETRTIDFSNQKENLRQVLMGITSKCQIPSATNFQNIVNTYLESISCSHLITFSNYINSMKFADDVARDLVVELGEKGRVLLKKEYGTSIVKISLAESAANPRTSIRPEIVIPTSGPNAPASDPFGLVAMQDKSSADNVPGNANANVFNMLTVPARKNNLVVVPSNQNDPADSLGTRLQEYFRVDDNTGGRGNVPESAKINMQNAVNGVKAELFEKVANRIISEAKTEKIRTSLLERKDVQDAIRNYIANALEGLLNEEWFKPYMIDRRLNAYTDEHIFYDFKNKTKTKIPYKLKGRILEEDISVIHAEIPGGDNVIELTNLDQSSIERLMTLINDCDSIIGGKKEEEKLNMVKFLQGGGRACSYRNESGCSPQATREKEEFMKKVASGDTPIKRGRDECMAKIREIQNRGNINGFTQEQYKNLSAIAYNKAEQYRGEAVKELAATGLKTAKWGAAIVLAIPTLGSSIGYVAGVEIVGLTATELVAGTVITLAINAPVFYTYEKLVDEVDGQKRSPAELIGAVGVHVGDQIKIIMELQAYAEAPAGVVTLFNKGAINTASELYTAGSNLFYKLPGQVITNPLLAWHQRAIFKILQAVKHPLGKWFAETMVFTAGEQFAKAAYTAAAKGARAAWQKDLYNSNEWLNSFMHMGMTTAMYGFAGFMSRGANLNAAFHKWIMGDMIGGMVEGVGTGVELAARGEWHEAHQVFRDTLASAVAMAATGRFFSYGEKQYSKLQLESYLKTEGVKDLPNATYEQKIRAAESNIMAKVKGNRPFSKADIGILGEGQLFKKITIDAFKNAQNYKNAKDNDTRLAEQKKIDAYKDLVAKIFGKNSADFKAYEAELLKIQGDADTNLKNPQTDIASGSPYREPPAEAKVLKASEKTPVGQKTDLVSKIGRQTRAAITGAMIGLGLMTNSTVGSMVQEPSRTDTVLVREQVQNGAKIAQAEIAKRAKETMSAENGFNENSENVIKAKEAIQRLTNAKDHFVSVEEDSFSVQSSMQKLKGGTSIGDSISKIRKSSVVRIETDVVFDSVEQGKPAESYKVIEDYDTSTGKKRTRMRYEVDGKAVYKEISEETAESLKRMKDEYRKEIKCKD